MLNAADNAVLTETGTGTPMGDLFRRFWMPVLLARELPEPDCAPVRLTIMGESLLAFRDTNGRVGLVDPRCPHRGADLFFGRNEDCGIRCVFHGLKFDVEGACVEAPILPRDQSYERMLAALKLKSYPVREWGDMVWAYMGPADRMPELPALEFALLPPEHRFVAKKLQECNWAQSLEGGIDTAHFSFLHMAVTRDEDERIAVMSRSEASANRDRVRWLKNDPMPRFTVLEHDAGFAIAASRKADGDDLYWRISQYLVPNHSLAPGTFPGENYHGQTWVPINDHACWIYTYSWNPERALTHREREQFSRGHGVHAEVDVNWVPIRNRSNNYLLDRDEQKHRSFTGITGLSEQDAAIQDSQGLIVDRTREVLGPTDLAIIRFRQLILRLAKNLASGVEPPAAHRAAAYFVRSGGALAPSSQPVPQMMRQRFGHEHALVGETAPDGAAQVRAAGD